MRSFIFTGRLAAGPFCGGHDTPVLVLRMPGAWRMARSGPVHSLLASG